MSNLAFSHECRCYFNQVPDCQLYVFREGGQVIDGYFSFLSVEYIKCETGWPSFSAEDRKMISQYILTHQSELLAEFQIDYFTMPDHFNLLDDDETKSLLLHYHPHWPHWQISWQLDDERYFNPAYRWSREFFKTALRRPIDEKRLAIFRKNYISDEQEYYDDELSWPEFLQAQDEIEKTVYTGKIPDLDNKLWKINGIEHLYYWEYMLFSSRSGATSYYTVSDYLWINEREARRVHTPAPLQGRLVGYIL